GTGAGGGGGHRGAGGKGGKDFLAGNSRREGRDFPKESIGKFFFSQIFSCAFGLIQKHQKIKQREK
uniref:hypothetical protein n=1 Tax=Alistipes communis TaxID=2585118 RepID=UPI003FD78496